MGQRKTSRDLGESLENLRRALGMTQAVLAERLGISQKALSHIEQREDLLVSTLCAYIRGLGGNVQVTANFPIHDPVVLVGDFAQRNDARAQTVEVSLTRESPQLRLPNVIRDEKRSPSRDVVFSIRPDHAKKILAGRKTVELRRRFADDVRPGTLALIYTTSPTRALTGLAQIRDVQRLTVPELWKNHRAAACVLKEDFEAYFSGRNCGYAIVLASARPLARPVGLSELRERFGFEPPQSYQYASRHLRSLVEHEWLQSPN